MLNLSDMLTIFERDLRIRIQSVTMVISMVVMPLSYLLFLVVGLDYIMPEIIFAGVSMSYFMFVIPGILSIGILTTSRLSGSILHIERRSGMLEALFASPLNRGSLALGRALANTVLCMVQAGAMIALACILFQCTMHLSWINPLVPLIVLISSLCFSSFGLILAAKIESEETFNALFALIIGPMTFISTAFFPPEALPRLLLPLIKINPLTYTVDSLRYVMVNNWDMALYNLGVLTLISVILFALACHTLSRAISA